MPLIGVILDQGNSGSQVGELHNQLQVLGAVIAPAEQNAKNFGESTAASVRAFRQQYGLPTGDNVDLSTGRLLHAAAAFAGPGGPFIQQYFRHGEFGEDPGAAARQNDLEAPLITLAFVLVPLARAELNRARRQRDAALRDLRWVLDSILVRRTGATPEDPVPRRVYARIACEFIELPFAKLLLAETMLDVPPLMPPRSIPLTVKVGTSVNHCKSVEFS
jgi:peptidoglycan hydrolase-like protein with peptidoglycan-binding domain